MSFEGITRKTIRVVHFSTTPMAGGPMRMIKMLNKYTNVEARLIDLHRNHVYEHDLVFTENPEECIEVAQKADVINFHNYLTLDSKDFSPIDFNRLKRKGVEFIIYYRTDPMYISAITKRSPLEIISSTMPAIVNGQYPERYFENARVVRNIMPDLSINTPVIHDLVNITSKGHVSAWASRWGTKGAPEFRKTINKSGLDRECDIVTRSNIAYEEAMKLKAAGKIILDDLVTGSYHMAGIEGLMLGKVTFAYLDERIETVLKVITGSNDIPFVNVHLSELPNKAREILGLSSLERDEMGKNSRRWFEKFWNEEDIALEYAKVYDALLDNPNNVMRQHELSNDELPSHLHYKSLDQVYRRKLRKLPTTHQALKFRAKAVVKRVLGRRPLGLD